jgi:DNA ligase D-like protein (predicted polymerase)
MRYDLAPEDVVLALKPEDATMLDEIGATETGADRVVGKARLTNQSKVFWPDDGITKGDLCDYYEAVAPVLLPHLRDRPVTLVRFPDGIDGKSFFQWRIPKQAPPWLQSLRLRSEEEDGKEVNTILINDLSSLMYVANLGCIPLHIIASRAGALDTCDFLTLDLDVELASLETAIPIALTILQTAIPIALTIRHVLEEVGLVGFPKSSGKTGLHVLVPLGGGLPFEVAKQLLELIARIVLQRHPEHATMERRKDKPRHDGAPQGQARRTRPHRRRPNRPPSNDCRALLRARGSGSPGFDTSVVGRGQPLAGPVVFQRVHGPRTHSVLRRSDGRRFVGRPQPRRNSGPTRGAHRIE